MYHGRTPRSRRDRAAIMEHLARNHPHRIREWPIKLQDYDRGPIVARSWHDRGPIVASFLKQSQPNKPQIPELRCRRVKPFLDAANPRPRPAPSPTISGLILSLKTHVLLLLLSTFDRFVKELSKFRGRS